MRLTVDVTTRTFWNDDALDASDIPGRGDFANAVAARIDQVPPGLSSAVFGLVGAWGTGKSTLLTEIRRHLDEAEWTVVDFSPWSAADVRSITGEFVAALIGAFPDSGGQKLRKQLLKYARFGAPALGVIPFAGGAASKVAENAVDQLASEPAWHVTFQRLSDQIAEQNKRVLVVVDDVDRLDFDELRSVLRVVRLLGRFRNVHYLLAYDQVTIDQNLRAGGADGGTSEFMEKIVQHPFEVPPVPMVTRRGWCRSIVEAHIGLDAGDGRSDSYLAQREDLIRILADGIETPRSASRLREQLDGLAALANDAEIDALDFIALTWLRLAQHAVWDDIRTRSHRYLGWTENDTSELPDPRLAHVSPLTVRGQENIVSQLLQFLFVRTTVGVTAGRKWRLHNERYFHRYFIVGLTDADVSERLIERALDEVLTDTPEMPAMEELRAIMVGDHGERGGLAIDLAAAARRDADGTTRSLMTFLRVLHAEVSAFKEDRFGRISSVDRWLGAEAERALTSKTMDVDEFVDEFGYWQLVRAGYAARRRHGDGFAALRAPFDSAVAAWIEKIQAGDFPIESGSNEIAVMTAFAQTLSDTTHRGFLAQVVTTGDDLIAIAKRFVDYNRWVGSEVHYEVMFRTKEFLFGVGDAIMSIDPDSFNVPSDMPNYEVHERSAADLSEGERRDFALRRVAAIRADLT